MGDHYYSQKPVVSSDKKRITETVIGETLHFFVDRGVFSKGGMDFGTRLLLESIELPTLEGDVVDAGCGWGAIGLPLASKYPERKFLMVDINERAVELAKENARLNSLENVEIFQNDLMAGITGQIAVVVTNPPIGPEKTLFLLYMSRRKEHCCQVEKYGS